MFGIGFVELLLLAAVGLIILGPEKLPIAAKNLGMWYGKLQRTLTNMQKDIETELNLQEARKQMQAELEKIKQAELEMKQNIQKMQQDISSMQENNSQDSNNQNINTKENNVLDSSSESHSQVNGQNEENYLVK